MTKPLLCQVPHVNRQRIYTENAKYRKRRGSSSVLLIGHLSKGTFFHWVTFCVFVKKHLPLVHYVTQLLISEKKNANQNSFFIDFEVN